MQRRMCQVEQGQQNNSGNRSKTGEKAQQEQQQKAQPKEDDQLGLLAAGAVPVCCISMTLAVFASVPFDAPGIWLQH